jgi:outer membrane protein assembly factor BamA
MAYLNFPAQSKQLIDASMNKALIRKGSPFNVANMESERQRITRLFRNRGYYFYQNSYASYLADTVNVPGKVQLRLMMADSVDDRATRQWYIGKIHVNFRKQYMEELKDSFVRSYLSFHYNGRKMPIRPGIVLQSLRLRPRELYRVRTEERAKTGLQEMGLFSYSSIQFTPRSVQTLDSLGNVVYRDTLDANIDLVFDKPYDFYVEANARGKTTGRVGPELVVGLTKRNAFHGGEKLTVNLHGSHEWQTISQAGGGSTRINSYEYGSDVSVEFPRIITPWNMFRTMEQNERRYRAGHMPTKYRGVPTTTVKASMNVLNRASYFRRHVAAGELTYAWSTSYQHQHSFSPLILSYEFMNSRTAAFDSILALHPYLQISMRDQFVPKMSYTYTYRSPRRYRHPITWSTTISEAANILSLGYMAAGKGWNEKDKKMFKNPFAQFLKLETDFVKYWRITQDGTLVGHVNAGIIWSYGNAANAPYYEQFYIGGANSVRAFNVRSIGPGRYQPTNSKYSYIDQTGDIKYLMNLEYRQKVWGDLYGALFLDAGNVWTLRNHEYSPLGKFDVDKFFRQLAVGTGVGVRYDMGMFVIRVDWGIGLHVPYDTGKNGFYNIRRFKDAQSLHFAVGYPF